MDTVSDNTHLKMENTKYITINMIKGTWNVRKIFQLTIIISKPIFIKMIHIL